MKMDCDVIQDLLILYEDEACSEKSKELVKEHLEECAECADYLKKLQSTGEALVPEITQETARECRAVKRSFHKIRKRWAMSLLIVLLLFPAAGIGLLGVHEYQGIGIAFSNLDDVMQCVNYLKCIERKDFEAAVQYIDFSQYDYQMFEFAKGMTEQQFVEYMKERYVKKLQEYDSLGIYINHVRYQEAYRNRYAGSNSDWSVAVTLDENYPDGSSQNFNVSLNGKTKIWESAGLPYLQFGGIIYIYEVMNLHVEEDPLNYHDYKTSFELKKGEKAVITWKNSEIKPHDLGELLLVNTTYGAANMDTISKKKFMQGKKIQLSVPGNYAFLAYDEEKDIDIMDYVDIEITPIE